jgi:hypothetical protein
MASVLVAEIPVYKHNMKTLKNVILFISAIVGAGILGYGIDLHSSMLCWTGAMTCILSVATLFVSNFGNNGT